MQPTKLQPQLSAPCFSNADELQDAGLVPAVMLTMRWLDGDTQVGFVYVVERKMQRLIMLL
jgi:hypothetical protein